MWGISYWALPLFSSLVWLAMLLAMLLWWVCKGSPHLPSMQPSQRIAYISDVGAHQLKPLFISMGTVSVIVFDLGFIAERWLRHVGRLAPNTSVGQKALSVLAILASAVGAVGLITLSIEDVYRHKTLHDTFLAVFIVGYIVNAIFVCWEYQRLGIHFRQFRILRASFWIKLAFILVEVALAIAFGVTNRTRNYNVAAILEWVIALIFTFYVLSYFVDFIPAVKHSRGGPTEEEMATASAQQPLTGDHHANRYGVMMNGYENGGNSAGRHYASPQHSNGYVNGATGQPKPEDGVLRAGQHF